MNLNIDYEKALDFEHCDNINEARNRLSQITNLLNRVISIRQSTKKDIIEECSKWKGENLHKLSWDNKLVRIAELLEDSALINLWQEADAAYRKLKNKQSQVMEDLLALKKMIDVTPR